MLVGYLRPVVQDDISFEPVSPRSGGSTPSLANYREITTNKIWIGKSQIGTSLESALRENMLEIVANNIYSYLSAQKKYDPFTLPCS